MMMKQDISGIGDATDTVRTVSAVSPAPLIQDSISGVSANAHTVSEAHLSP
jgi:hypothetical protein